jgi:hypothetical protein
VTNCAENDSMIGKIGKIRKIAINILYTSLWIHWQSSSVASVGLADMKEDCAPFLPSNPGSFVSREP